MEKIGKTAERSIKKLSLKKKLLYSLAAYAMLGSCFDRCVLEVYPHMPRFGRACEKNYVPMCLTKDFKGSLILKEVGGKPPIIHTNSLGYIGGEIKMPKPKGVYRIACFGGSTTFCPMNAPYPSQLERLLNSDKNGQKRLEEKIDFEVINASMISYSITEAEGQLRNEFVNLEVDMAIVSEPWNFRYMNEYSKLIGWTPKNGMKSLPSRLIGDLPLYPIISNIVVFGKFLMWQKKYHQENLEDDLQNYMQCIDRIYSLTKDNGITLVLGIHPDAYSFTDSDKSVMVNSFNIDGMQVYGVDSITSYRFKRAITRYLRNYAIARDIPSIDWEMEFDELPKNKRERLIEQDKIHPNEDGAGLMAKLAKEKIGEIVAKKRY